jgi:broad specificity phosphatase PhoE
MPGVDVRVLVLRHGRSEWNALRRWQGTFDSPLDRVGRSQATVVADELARMDLRWGSPVSSTLVRAAETADIVAGRLGLASPRLDPRLAEADAGEWQGLTPAEIEAAYPGWLAAHRRPPSFEPFESVVARATEALLDVARSVHEGATGLVVSHSGVIRSVVRSLGITDTRIPNLGGVWFRVDHRSSADHPRLVVDQLYDPHGVVISGVDAPGEDPGDQPDQPEHHRRAER